MARINVEDTNTIAWDATPYKDTVSKNMPEIVPVLLERYSVYPLKEIAMAIRSHYEKEAFDILEQFSEDGTMPQLAFADSKNSRVLQGRKREDIPQNLWVIGDLHGDLLALRAILEYIEEYPSDEPPYFVFLGDCYDRFEYGYEVLLSIFHLMKKYPGRVTYLVGNHDVELYYKKNLNVFYPGVMPADFCDWLNRESQIRPEISLFGQRLIGFMKALPHVLFLADGMFMAHAGVPHSDLQDFLLNVNDLNTLRARQDFTWARFDTRSAYIPPDRSHKDSPLGFMDFENFCHSATDVLGLPVSRMLHGHEHPFGQWHVQPHFMKHPLYTINSHRMLLAGGGLTSVAIAKHKMDSPPEIHLLDLTIPYA